MKWRHFFLVIVFAAVVAGCATESPKHTDDLATLKDKVWNLQKQTAELGIELSETSNDVALLSERLDSLTKSMEADREKAPDSQTKTLPHAPDGQGKSESVAVEESAPVAPAPLESADKQEEPAPNGKQTVKQNEKKSEPANPHANETVVANSDSAAIPVEVDNKFRGLESGSMYRQAMVLFNTGEYARSADAFRYFTRRYPGSPLVPGARYWMGESFYGRKQYKRAAEEFGNILARYPKCLKAPDAMLKLGFCKIKLDKTEEGKAVLREVVKKYPLSVAAITAKRELEKAANGKAKKLTKTTVE